MASTDDWLYNDDLDVNISEVSRGTCSLFSSEGSIFLAICYVSL